MKLQAITVAAFLAVASTDVVDAKQGGVRRKTKEAHKKKNAAHHKHNNAAHAKSKAATTAKRELGNKKKSSSKSDKCDVPIFPTECNDGDLQPSWVGVKGEVCLAAGWSLCRKKHNWQFGVTAPMPMMGGGMMPGMGMDPIPGPEHWGILPKKPGYYPGKPNPGPGCDSTWGCPLPDLSSITPQSEPTNGGGNMAGGGMMGPGDRRKLGKKKWDKKPMPSGGSWMYGYGKPTILPSPMMPPPMMNLPEPPLPYNVTDASAHLWRGPDCDPVWSFPHPTTDVCVGMVGKDDFTNSTFAASSYLTFKNSTLPGAANPDGDMDLDGDYWFIFHPLVGGDWKSMPRLKLDPSIDDGIVMKFKRGPDGKDNEDLLMAIDKDGDVFLNPYGQLFFAPDGDRTKAFMVDVSVAFPPPMMMTEEMMKKYGLMMPMPDGAYYSF